VKYEICTADGKAKATVAPDGTPASFFLRVKVDYRNGNKWG